MTENAKFLSHFHTFRQNDEGFVQNDERGSNPVTNQQKVIETAHAINVVTVHKAVLGMWISVTKAVLPMQKSVT